MNHTQRSCLFFSIYGAANIGLMLYGLLALARPSVLLETFSLHVYRFPEDASAGVVYLGALFRLLGFFNLLLGSLGLVLLWQFRRNQFQWIRLTVIATSLLSYLAPIVFDNTVGRIGFFEILEHILFAAMLLAGPGLMLKRQPSQKVTAQPAFKRG